LINEFIQNDLIHAAGAVTAASEIPVSVLFKEGNN
jgi:hypothetical protein